MKLERWTTHKLTITKITHISATILDISYETHHPSRHTKRFWMEDPFKFNFKKYCINLEWPKIFFYNKRVVDVAWGFIGAASYKAGAYLLATRTTGWGPAGAILKITSFRRHNRATKQFRPTYATLQLRMRTNICPDDKGRKIDRLTYILTFFRELQLLCKKHDDTRKQIE